MSKPRKKNQKGYKFPDKLPVGEILRDVHKKEWVLGSSIGQGGFGEIYCAKESSGRGNNYPFVVKIEPNENGPLFVEQHFYIKLAKTDDVESWKKDEGVKVLGIPTYYGFGSHDFKQEKYRFLVIERYGKDIWSIFLENGNRFSHESIYRCAIQIIDILKYIHSKGYVHADIKGANLLLGLKKGTENNVFLVDFGLACRYSMKEFKRDPKRCHNGTIEYTSRDWHLGVPTRRGDMEILGFNFLHWAASNLPWEVDLKNPEIVHQKKEKLMKNVKNYFKTYLPEVPSVISDYLNYVSNLKHDEEPNYDLCKNFFKKELERMSCSINGKLNFESVQNGVASGVRRKKGGTPQQNKKLKIDSEYSNLDSESSSKKDTEADTRGSENLKKPQKVPGIKKPKVENKVSWKDAATIKASNVNRAGEYTRTAVLNKVKKKKK